MRKDFWPVVLLILLCVLTVGCKARDAGMTEAMAHEIRRYSLPDVERVAPINVYHFDDAELIALCFHHVDNTGSVLSATRDQVGSLAVELANNGYVFVDANDIVRYRMHEEKMPDKMALFSFDDGYADNYDALTLLEDYGIKGTFFVISSRIGEPGYLTADQIKDMDERGFAIGSHTANHENLLDISASAVDDEMRISKEKLESILGHPVLSVAYPGGFASNTIEQIAEKYYKVGFLAASDPRVKETNMAIKRWGVFNYNHTIRSILNNEQ